MQTSVKTLAPSLASPMQQRVVAEKFIMFVEQLHVKIENYKIYNRLTCQFCISIFFFLFFFFLNLSTPFFLFFLHHHFFYNI